MVKFPNLVGAIAAKGKKHYEIAIAVGMHESTFSRCVQGLRDFSYEQRRKIAVLLGCAECWLFKNTWRPRAKWNKSKAGGWLVWDGARWAKDATGEVERRAKETAISIYSEAVAAKDEDDRQVLARWAHQSQSESRIRAMISLAETELGVVVSASQLDTHPWLLNCKNGTIDLQTGELLSHRRDDLITKLVPVDYNPHANCPRFLNFLAEIMGGNAQLVEYLLRGLGYALTGDTREQVLHLFYGTGANGKSTLLETLRGLLGDYAAQADFSTFLAKKHVEVRNGIARLAGVRRMRRSWQGSEELRRRRTI